MATLRIATGETAETDLGPIEFIAYQPMRQDRLGDQLYEQILFQIVSGRLPEGGRLPSEPQLCNLFKVSRPVVREALSRLRADGLIASRRGSGSYVKSRPAEDLVRLAPTGAIADLLRCFELRYALEGEAAALAAQRRETRDLEEIKRTLDALASAVATHDLAADVDASFHLAIAAATKNQLFTRVMAMLDSPMRQGIYLGRRLSQLRNTERLQLVQTEHERIYEAIESGDPEAARTAMRHHIGSSRRRILGGESQP